MPCSKNFLFIRLFFRVPVHIRAELEFYFFKKFNNVIQIQPLGFLKFNIIGADQRFKRLDRPDACLLIFRNEIRKAVHFSDHRQ